MNLIPFIAEKLGVKIGEKFKISGHDRNVYIFDDSRLVSINNHGILILEDQDLADLVKGVKTITKIPFRPKIGEGYIYIESVCQNGYIVTYRDTNQGKFKDYERIKIGNCFKSRDEAENGYPELEKYIREGVDY